MTLTFFSARSDKKKFKFHLEFRNGLKIIYEAALCPVCSFSTERIDCRLTLYLVAGTAGCLS